MYIDHYTDTHVAPTRNVLLLLLEPMPFYSRDSVVNQLLAKMDGVQPLAVPTLVIGLTNKRSLIEPGK